MEEKIKKVLSKHGLTVDLLTKEEIEQLKEEIKIKEQRGKILDGLFSDPSIIYRRAAKS